MRAAVLGSLAAVTLSLSLAAPAGEQTAPPRDVRAAPTGTRPARALELRSFHEWTGKPLMVTEFGFRGMDSGLPNSFPPGWLLQPTVPTQKDRADKFEQCVTAWLSQPYFVGCHWFQHMDEPKAGRFDGENGNYGVVDIHDEPHAPLVERFTAVNRRVWDLHKAAK